MKTVTAAELVAAYDALYPNEHKPVDGVDLLKHKADIETTFSRWLDRYREFPDLALATTNWQGKVTTALFKALGIKQPRLKTAMLRALMDMEDVVGQYLYPTGIVYADKTRDDPATQDYKRLAYLNYASLQLDLEGDLKGELRAYVISEAAKIQGMRGQSFQIAGNASVILGQPNHY